MRTITCGITVLCALGGVVSAQPADHLSAEPDVLPAKQIARPVRVGVDSTFVADATAQAAQLVALTPRKQPVAFEIPGGTVSASLRVLRDNGPDHFSLAGSLADETASQVVVTVERGVVLASVVSPSRGSFRIQSNGDGYDLVSVDASTAGGCGEPIEPEHHAHTPKFSATIAPPGLRAPCSEDGSGIDVLVVYTPGAVTLAGGQAAMDTLIQASIDEMNLALSNSLVPTQVNLAWSEEVSYTTSGSFSTDLARLRDPSDGYMDSVPQLRDDLKADLVCLISEPGDVCGIAYISVLAGETPNEDLGFSVVNVNCATAPVSAFAHELGHNFGVRHEWAALPCANGATKYAKAYIEPSDTFETVVATGTAPRVLYYSNPDVNYGGMPTGVAEGMTDPADAARTITEVAPEVAAYRSRDCNGNGICDVDDIAAMTSLDCNANGYPDECEIDWNHNGVPDDCDITSGTSLDTDGDGVPDEVELSRIYVDQSATGAETGAGWGDARTDLQEALAIAEASGDVSEIWVASGTYKPVPNTWRDRPFDIPPGVSMYGGFAGTETSLDQRDIAANPTILSGDLLGDDATGVVNRDDNSLHVVHMWQAGTLDFDGFTVTGGMAEFPPNCNLDNYAGGMFVFGTDVTIRNCLFTENAGVYGGGLAVVQNSHGNIVDSDFISNDAISTPSSASGAAMYFSNGPVAGSDPVVVNCRVIGNHSPGSAAVVNIGGVPSYTNCLFLGNRAYWLGAAMSNSSANGADAIVTNCTFVDNETQYSIYSGGIENYKSDPVITNTLLWNNRNGSGATEQAQISNVVSTPVINYSILENWSGSMGGVGNSGLDPLFVDELGADMTAGTLDDDLRLSAGSPALDAGDADALPADILDLDADADTAETIPFDLDNSARLVDDPTPDTGVGSVTDLDLGAYERNAGPTACSPADVTTTGAGIGDPGYGVPDGSITAADIQFYVNLYVAADPAADLTTTGAAVGDPGYGVPDGSITAADIQFYVNLYVAGCP